MTDPSSERTMLTASVRKEIVRGAWLAQKLHQPMNPERVEILAASDEARAAALAAAVAEGMRLRATAGALLNAVIPTVDEEGNIERRCSACKGDDVAHELSCPTLALHDALSSTSAATLEAVREAIGVLRAVDDAGLLNHDTITCSELPEPENCVACWHRKTLANPALRVLGGE